MFMCSNWNAKTKIVEYLDKQGKYIAEIWPFDRALCRSNFHGRNDGKCALKTRPIFDSGK